MMMKLHSKDLRILLESVVFYRNHRTRQNLPNDELAEIRDRLIEARTEAIAREGLNNCRGCGGDIHRPKCLLDMPAGECPRHQQLRELEILAS